jgi:hypothetical protein
MTCLTNPISQTGLEILPTCNWRGWYEVTGFLLTSISSIEGAVGYPILCQFQHYVELVIVGGVLRGRFDM